MEEKIKINNDQDLKILDVEPEVKEFMRKTDGEESKGSKSNVSWMIGVLLVFAAVVLCGIFLCKLPVLLVFLVAGLEAVLSLCLCRSPIWLHGLVLLFNIISGILFHMPIFMLLACAVYLSGIWVLHMRGSR